MQTSCITTGTGTAVPSTLTCVKSKMYGYYPGYGGSIQYSSVHLYLRPYLTRALEVTWLRELTRRARLPTAPHLICQRRIPLHECTQ
eukprot:SAG31_NODE_2084_length_6489_cov_7.773239_3_plen_87_part_00